MKEKIDLDYPIRQYKLITGEEIVCQVVEDSTENEDYFPSLIRYPMCIILKPMNMIRYYSLTPWMTAVYDVDTIITLDPNSIISSCNPSDELVEQYKIWCESIYEADHQPSVDDDEVKEENNKIIDFVDRMKSIRTLQDIDSDYTMH